MAEISKITIPVGSSTQTFDIKDATARDDLSSLGALASKNSASGSSAVTSVNVTQPIFDGTTGTVIVE